MRRRRAAAAPLRNPPRPRPPPSSSAPPSASNPAPAPSCPRRTAPRHSAAPTDWGGGVATRALIGRRAAPPPSISHPPAHPPPLIGLKGGVRPVGHKKRVAAHGGAGAPLPRRNVTPQPFCFAAVGTCWLFCTAGAPSPPFSPPPLPSAPPGQKKKAATPPPILVSPAYFSARIRNKLIFPVQPMEAGEGGRWDTEMFMFHGWVINIAVGKDGGGLRGGWGGGVVLVQSDL